MLVKLLNRLEGSLMFHINRNEFFQSVLPGQVSGVGFTVSAVLQLFPDLPYKILKVETA